MSVRIADAAGSSASTDTGSNAVARQFCDTAPSAASKRRGSVDAAGTRITRTGSERIRRGRILRGESRRLPWDDVEPKDAELEGRSVGVMGDEVSRDKREDAK